MTPTDLDPFEATLQPTEELWRRLARPFDLPATVDALLGLSPEVVQQLAGMLTATCPEAEALISGMPRTLRNLKTAVGADMERCVGELRGPVQWSATVSAQASSLGNRDVYVCASPRRAYDIDENRVLVAALGAVAEAGRHLDRGADDGYEDDSTRRARHNARLARRYLDHRSLDGVQVEGRPSPRAIKRTRGGRSSSSYGAAIAMLDRAAEPLSLEELAPYCDRRTRVQHGLLLSIIDDLEARGMRVPSLRAESGSLFAGPVEYVHPRRRGDRSRVHGIVIGNVLVDVPERLKDRDRDVATAALQARSHGRPVVAVVDRDDVIGAVDRAILAARGT
ncbi:MAG: hypothetical protein AAF081_13540 [Actinomycetota bacterium]